MAKQEKELDLRKRLARIKVTPASQRDEDVLDTSHVGEQGAPVVDHSLLGKQEAERVVSSLQVRD